MSRHRDYTTIAIPNALIEEIETIIKRLESLGYRNRTEFIVDSIRRRIEELKKLYPELQTR